MTILDFIMHHVIQGVCLGAFVHIATWTMNFGIKLLSEAVQGKL